MNLWWLIVAGVGLVIVSLSVAAARQPSISPAESRVFHAVNGLPDCAVSVPLVADAARQPRRRHASPASLVALVDGDLAVAIGVLLAMVLKLVVERVVRKEMADYLAVRQRPGTSQVDAVLRGGDVPSSGPSFPSGHVILVAGVGCVVAAEPAVHVVVGSAHPHRAGDGRPGVRRRPQPARRHRRTRRRPAPRRRHRDTRQLTHRGRAPGTLRDVGRRSHPRQVPHPDCDW